MLSDRLGYPTEVGDKDWEALNGPERDDKGRKNVKLMTDRELLEECVIWQRVTGDTIEKFMDGLAKNPMMKAMGARFGL